jgi:hypothetical protein
LLLAVQLDEGNFELKAGSRLGPIELEPVVSQPRALDDAGRPRFDLFVFRALDRRDIELVAVGETVELIGAARPEFD